MNIFVSLFPLTILYNVLCLKPLLESNRRPYTVINLAQEPQPEESVQLNSTNNLDSELLPMISKSLQNATESQNLLDIDYE